MFSRIVVFLLGVSAAVRIEPVQVVKFDFTWHGYLGENPCIFHGRTIMLYKCSVARLCEFAAREAVQFFCRAQSIVRLYFWAACVVFGYGLNIWNGRKFGMAACSCGTVLMNDYRVSFIFGIANDVAEM